MGHLAFVGSHKVNGVSALHTDLMRETVFPDLAQALPGPHHQQDQRHHAAALADAGQSRASPRCCVDAHRRRTGWTISTRLATLEPLRRATPAFQERFAAVKRANKERLAGVDPRARSASRVDPRRDVRRADQAHPRIQAPAAQHPADDRALQRDPRRTRRATGCRGSKIFAGKAAAELPHGQADHQADQRRRRADQQRSRGAQPAEGRLPAELQCQPGRAHHSRRRPVASRSRPPAWRPRAPAT